MIGLGIDFGTATTCAAIVTDAVSLRPVLVDQGDAGHLVGSYVWFDHTSRGRNLLPLPDSELRVPQALFEAAQDKFDGFWKERLGVRSELALWDKWIAKGRESAMLLSYFKPELADPRRATSYTFESPGPSSYDQLTQSETTSSYSRTRTIASPAPDTDDYIEGTAALLRAVTENVYRQFGRVSRVAMGMPSFAHDRSLEVNDEQERASSNRTKAIRRSCIVEDFCTSDARVVFEGEALAAAWGLELEYEHIDGLVIIIDVGAGTTDLSVVHVRRSGRGYRPEQELSHSSIRLAGRDINYAILTALREKYHQLREAVHAMDVRATQWLLDKDAETMKLSLGTHSEAQHTIPFPDYDRTWEGTEFHRRRRSALSRVLPVRLGIHDHQFDWAMSVVFASWDEELRLFLTNLPKVAGPSASSNLICIEMVGGALRFAPLRKMVEKCIVDSGLGAIPVRYRDQGSESQTVVAKGLARIGMLA